MTILVLGTPSVLELQEVQGEWEDRPTQYHVIFFGGKEKGISRAWVVDKRLESLLKGEKSSSKRLCQAIENGDGQAGRKEGLGQEEEEVLPCSQV